MNIRSISAVTLAVADMARSVDFYGDKIGLEILYGGTSASFTSYRIGDGYINLTLEPSHIPAWWGRLIFYVDDVDSIYKRLVDAGLNPSTQPANASWGERYFHINDPDSHELSFAKPI
ncbi:MAG: glyoxalase [Dehalococcoidia bacterium]|nr:MAG: glyoxalase [Dehalococcoidia bacterium]